MKTSTKIWIAVGIIILVVAGFLAFKYLPALQQVTGVPIPLGSSGIGAGGIA